MKRMSIGLIALAMVAGMLGTAGAVQITYDFTGATQFNSESRYFEVDGVGVTATATWNGFNRRAFVSGLAEGMGVAKDANDDPNIDGLGFNDFLHLTFDTAVTLRGFSFGLAEANDEFDLYLDRINTRVVNNGETSFDQWVMFDTGLFTATTFTIRANGNNDDFVLAGMKIDPVPEPGTLLLLGTGLVGLAGYGRKRRAAGV